MKTSDKNDTIREVDGEGEGDLEFREEDRDFIDDEGVALEERVDFADDANAITFDEAEEAKDDMDDELDRMFGRAARRESAGGIENAVFKQKISWLRWKLLWRQIWKHFLEKNQHCIS